MARGLLQLASGNIYHVISRGNNKQDIAFEDRDYFRLIHDLYEFNDEDAAVSTYRGFLSHNVDSSGSDPDYRVAKGIGDRKKRKLLVEILAFCLMPNHFHLLLRQLKDGGIPLFMKKIKGGYAAYINKKYERTGSLFQSHFKAVGIADDSQLHTIFSYIHTNPCQLMESEWKTAGLKDEEKAVETLNSYRWSSYLDYIGRKNFPSLTNREMFTEMYGGQKGCEDSVRGWIQHKSDSYEEVRELVLE